MRGVHDTSQRASEVKWSGGGWYGEARKTGVCVCVCDCVGGVQKYGRREICVRQRGSESCSRRKRYTARTAVLYCRAARCTRGSSGHSERMERHLSSNQLDLVCACVGLFYAETACTVRGHSEGIPSTERSSMESACVRMRAALLYSPPALFTGCLAASSSHAPAICSTPATGAVHHAVAARLSHPFWLCCHGGAQHRFSRSSLTCAERQRRFQPSHPSAR